MGKWLVWTFLLADEARLLRKAPGLVVYNGSNFYEGQAGKSTFFATWLLFYNETFRLPIKHAQASAHN